MTSIALALHLPADSTHEQVVGYLQAMQAEAARATPGPWAIGTTTSVSGETYNPSIVREEPQGSGVCQVYGIPLHQTLRECLKSVSTVGLVNAEFIARSRQNVPELASALLIALEDAERLRWAFGDPENGASRDQIEHLLMHCTTLEEARVMIDSAREGR